MKKRVGNDVKYDWIILHNGVAEDFTLATGIALTCYMPNTCCIITPSFTRIDNLFHVTIAAADLTVGTYNTKLTYQKPDTDVFGGMATFTIDYVAVVQMVRVTDLEEEGDITIESEVNYSVDGATFTPVITEVSDLITNLSWINDKGKTNPATTNIKGAKGEDADIAAAEAATDAANQAASYTNAVKDATIIVKSDTLAAKDLCVIATQNANTATQNANTATQNANEATGLANIATQNANTATGLANTATLNANAATLSANNNEDARNIVGGIAHNAAAPTPGVSCRYIFTSEGSCTWITGGAVTVAINDTVIVTYVSPSTYTYTYLATAASFVGKSGNETISGIKTFSSSPIIPAPTTDMQPVNKLSIDNVELTTAETLNVLYNRIIALELFLANMAFGTTQIDTLNVVKALNIFGTTNMILTGTAAPSVIPDFIGQVFVKTSATVAVYTATGITSVNDWKQTA